MNAGAVGNSTVLRADVGRFPIILISNCVISPLQYIPGSAYERSVVGSRYLQDLS